jgi:hypothetical protein
VTAGTEHVGDGPSTILAAVDGSVTSLRAGAYAAGMAQRQGARLVVVHVATLPALAGLASGLPVVADDILAAASDDVRRLVEEGAAYSHTAVEFVATRGDAFTEIRRIAMEHLVDAARVARLRGSPSPAASIRTVGRRRPGRGRRRSNNRWSVEADDGHLLRRRRLAAEVRTTAFLLLPRPHLGGVRRVRWSSSSSAAPT